jgi:hypothetical protein
MDMHSEASSQCNEGLYVAATTHLLYEDIQAWRKLVSWIVTIIRWRWAMSMAIRSVGEKAVSAALFDRFPWGNLLLVFSISDLSSVYPTRCCPFVTREKIRLSRARFALVTKS